MKGFATTWRQWFCSFLLLAGATTCAGAPADMPDCSDNDFGAFFAAFAQSEALQQSLVADPLIEQRIYPGRKQPRVAIRKLAPEQRPSLALLQPAKRAALGLVVEQEGSRQVVLHDTKGELLKVYTFTRGQCWVLQRIDDWSLAGFFTGRQEKVAGELDVERARLYENLGRAGLYDNPGQLMNAALNSLLSAATKGNNEAAVQAVILIFSGDAERLPDSTIVQLLEAAMVTERDAGAMLAHFVCYGEEYAEDRVCQDPGKALQALRQSAKLESPRGLVELGFAYEAGKLGQQDNDRAMACYQQAALEASGYRDSAVDGIKRLSDKGVVEDETQKCL
ncbi:sel1 repeat family protein [Pseudomonas sp. B21-012]|uniref:sel1 repeat family protein n=1 Tax=unclassified Pseudomonas TaxID=196821 RepID=UPI000888A09F|nr:MULTISPECIES: sel1 repeat family protein [unclassified Pseudomonas]QVM96832.1 sel1 repeat family protein [Pseudomonas sp. SORT22]UVL56310.1 sel1 repeat family protein [Pseudomonas sp. B21-035]UVL61598.1 sel1 repeat family protein [Pseudomonas sp. B21-032]UVM55911.1 sel1 repeat family protein [Pseudomonas sp. B21-012]SDQ26953.1 hypothetical protein SAMN05216487_0732 [Pseudomonas sp. UC 17F4]